MTAGGYTRGQLLDDTDCDVLIDRGTSKSYMSKSYFLQCKNLHACNTMLFVIPVIITNKNHRFEVFTLVSEIHENVDLVLGIKNLFELEKSD